MSKKDKKGKHKNKPKNNANFQSANVVDQLGNKINSNQINVAGKLDFSEDILRAKKIKEEGKPTEKVVPLDNSDFSKDIHNAKKINGNNISKATEEMLSSIDVDFSQDAENTQ